MRMIARSRACALSVALFLGCFGGGFGGGAAAQAGLVESFTSESFGQTTDWTYVFQLPQFDDLDGARTLVSVVVTLDSSIDAIGGAENLESWDNSITLSVDASIGLSFLDELLMAPSEINQEEMFIAAPFDGDVDFLGPSGASFDLSGFAVASTARSGDDDLSPWIGEGLVDLVGEAASLSMATGPGNVAFNFQAAAFAQVTIRYEYIPTPGAWSILLASVLMLTPRFRRRAVA